MTHNHPRHTHGSGRSSLWRSSFLYRTGFREVNLINNKKSPIQDEYIEKYLSEKELDLTAAHRPFFCFPSSF